MMMARGGRDCHESFAGLLHILLVDLVHRRLSLIISGVGEVFLQASQLALQTLILLGKGETLIDWIGNIIIVVSQVAAPAHVSIVQVLLILVSRIIVTLPEVMMAGGGGDCHESFAGLLLPLPSSVHLFLQLPVLFLFPLHLCQDVLNLRSL